MPFNSEARRRLQKFVNDARAVIERSFLEALQGTFGMDPETGAVTDMNDLRHLGFADFETARTLRSVLAHYQAQSPETPDEVHLRRILREQTQTFLLRICALRMAEERGAVMRSISGGLDAPGFGNYRLVVGNALGDGYGTYVRYLKSLFDELAGELPQLFDRTEPFGLLFLEEEPFHRLLELIEAGDLESFWAEDETIGWIFQYFNSDADFATMRGQQNKNPRNSHELAVRNQFFTPRYVVELLLSNTLGRVWVQETGGRTALIERCPSLVNFEADGREVTVLRDPRTIRMLDPACGSMHFGLYAFDLLEVIYREAWDWLEAHPGATLDTRGQGTKAEPLRDLRNLFSAREDFLAAVPGLILKYNIHGVDIDVRATQTASLALWLRAQKALDELGVPAGEKRSVGTGNVVAALAPPAEEEVLARIQKELGDQGIQLESMMENLKFVPEAGLLLPLEKGLEKLVSDIRENAQGDLFADAGKFPSSTWDRQRSDLERILADYENRCGHKFVDRLYARNTAECLKLIELCRLHYDVIVMNPPFGSPADGSRETLGKLYPSTKREIIGMFVSRMQELLGKGGFAGCISSRTIFFQGSSENWRDEVVFSGAVLPVFTDLGPGVMDNALVESAAYVLGDVPQGTAARRRGLEAKTFFLDATRNEDKEARIREICGALRKGAPEADGFHARPLEEFTSLPGKVLAYGADEHVLQAYARFKLKSFIVPNGMTTGDNNRYIRLAQEVESARKRWVPLAKGGEAKPFYGDVPTVVNWETNGEEILQESKATPRNQSHYFRPGLTWTLRANALSLRAFPKDGIFDRGGSCVFTPTDNPQELLALSALLNSRAYQNVMAVQLQMTTGNSRYECGMLSDAPVPPLSPEDTAVLAGLARRNTLARRRLDSVNETSHAFLLPMKLQTALEHLDPQAELAEIAETQDEMDRIADNLYGFTSRVLPKQEKSRAVTLPDEAAQTNALLSWAVGVAFGRFDRRLALEERDLPAEPEPFDAYPKRAPGRLPEGDTPFIANRGVFVMDPGHPLDLAAAVHAVLDDFNLTDSVDVRKWLEKDFFPWHLKEYSAAQRVAPVYWPVGTASGSYVLWLYWPALDDQTFYMVLVDFIDPKIRMVSMRCDELRRQEDALDRRGREELRALTDLSAELAVLRDDVEKLARGFHVHFDDGVEINASRLRHVIRSGAWVKKRLDPAAEALERGELDWSETAAELFPERVLKLCRKNRSVALAQKAFLARHPAQEEA